MWKKLAVELFKRSAQVSSPSPWSKSLELPPEDVCVQVTSTAALLLLKLDPYQQKLAVVQKQRKWQLCECQFLSSWV